MVKTRGGSVGSRGASTSTLIGENEKGEPIPLQIIPPRQQPEVPTPRTENLGLPWKEDTLVEEARSRAGNDDQNRHHDMDVPPTSDNIAKNPNPLSASDAKVDNAETLESSIRDKDGSYHGPQGVEVEESSVKGTPNLSSPKSHSLVDPTVAEILTKLGKGRVGGRIKRVLRKQKPPVRHVPQTVKLIVVDTENDSSEKNLNNDDIVVVSETASRRRTRASVAALKTKREVAGLEEERSKSGEPIDLEELEYLNKKKKVAEKGKGKRPCFEKSKVKVYPRREKGSPFLNLHKVRPKTSL
ncbi:hypothetical protein LIER_31358 [Lithospermum erythrorhizon]|uniref:Uncharacterized protein n=1 Tax=Lithospermum erythrorhizon TaxID=34254 RepID=A0AAV3RWM3_LITER